MASLWVAGPHGFGYATSVSAEPLIDNEPYEAMDLVYTCRKAGAKTIWLGMLNKPAQRIVKADINDREYQRLIGQQTTYNFHMIYEFVHEIPEVRWKISVCELLGLPERTEADLD
jgi:hypothetical protein